MKPTSDRRQRDIDNRRVEHDDEVREREKYQPRPAAIAPTPQRVRNWENINNPKHNLRIQRR
jgi:hypothetical protein